MLPSYLNTGKTIRISRIFNLKTQRAAVVAFDHGVHLGVIPGNIQPEKMMYILRDNGADAFLVGPGIARTYSHVFAGRGAPGLILRLDWTNLWRDADHLGNPEGQGRLIASVEDAARLGADAVLVYMFVGYQEPQVEASQVEKVAAVAQACDRLGMGCIIEPMPRGMRVGEDTYNPEYIQLAARMACEIGADVLKTDYTGSSGTFKDVIDASFRPVLIAGGPRTKNATEALNMVRGALDAGANGMFIGRNVFQAEDPGTMMRAFYHMIHDDLTVEQAASQLPVQMEDTQ